MKIKGTVTDSLTGEGLKLIKVSCQSKNMVINKRTNNQGEFEFDVTRGWWHISAGCTPYEHVKLCLKTEILDRRIYINLEMPGLVDGPITG